MPTDHDRQLPPRGSEPPTYKALAYVLGALVLALTGFVLSDAHGRLRDNEVADAQRDNLLVELAAITKTNAQRLDYHQALLDLLENGGR